MKLPDDLPETPYTAAAFRVTHDHVDDEKDPDFPGRVLLEIGAQLPGTEADLVVPFRLTPDMVIGIAEELLASYRCMTYGYPEDEDAEAE